LIRAVRAAGFGQVEIIRKYPSLYNDVPVPSDALEFGTLGITFRARKPAQHLAES
jgi:hypothetical protein